MHTPQHLYCLFILSLFVSGKEKRKKKKREEEMQFLFYLALQFS